MGEDNYPRPSFDRSSITASIDITHPEQVGAPAEAPEPAAHRSQSHTPQNSDETDTIYVETKQDPFETSTAHEDPYPYSQQDSHGMNQPTLTGETDEEGNGGFSLRNILPRRASTRSRHSRKSEESQATEKSRHVMEKTFEERLDAIKEEDEPEDDDQLVDLKQAQNEFMEKDVNEKAETRRRRRTAIKDYTTTSSGIAKMRRWYRKVINCSLATRMFIYWLPVAIILFIPLAVDAFGKRQLRLGHCRVMWLFIWIEVVWGSLFIGRLFAHYIPELVGVFIAIMAPRWFKFVDAVVAMEWPNTLVIWTFVSFITFYPITSDNHKATSDARGVQEWEHKLNQVMAAFLVSSLVYWCEQILIYKLSTSYHRTRMALRIQRDKAAINILTILFEMSVSFFPVMCPEFEQEDRLLLSSSLAAKEDLREKYGRKFKQSKVAKNISKALDGTTQVFGQLRRDLMDQQLPPNGRIVEDALSRGFTSRVLAERIWKSLVLEGSEYLEMSDLEELLGPERKAEAWKMFDLIDPHDKRELSMADLQVTFREIHKEHKAIAKSLVDIDSVISKLNRLLICVCLLIVIIIFVGMLAPSVGAVLATLGSSLLALSFIFSATCQEILASCVYLFVKHPCDIGDVVLVAVPGTVGLQRMSVQEISLLYTVFQDASSSAIRQVSNSVLNTLFVDNISRSPPQCFNVDMTLGVPDTSFDSITELKNRVDVFLEEHAREYVSNPWFQLTEMPDLDRIRVQFQITPRLNMEDSTAWGNRRWKFLRFLNETVRELNFAIPRRDIQNTSPDAPFFTVAMDPHDPIVTGIRQDTCAARNDPAKADFPPQRPPDPEVIPDLARTTTSASRAMSISSTNSVSGRRRAHMRHVSIEH